MERTTHLAYEQGWISNGTLRERGFGFDYAARIFDGLTIVHVDGRFDYGETRMRALGAVGKDVLRVVYTDRGGLRRIISARPANRKERREWYGER
jgi:uncharacterized DUF497 family protein